MTKEVQEDLSKRIQALFKVYSYSPSAHSTIVRVVIANENLGSVGCPLDSITRNVRLWLFRFSLQLELWYLPIALFQAKYIFLD
jgi:hypothetical protein